MKVKTALVSMVEMVVEETGPENVIEGKHHILFRDELVNAMK